MSVISEERFRELVDARGILRRGALAPPDRSTAYCVFAQRKDAALDTRLLKAHAERFFATKLGLTVDKDYGEPPPEIDAARIVVASDDTISSGTRLCFGRPTNASDLAAADLAERAQG
ncbi:MAG TPA: hypothetical protein VM580_35225, partial [Labilithrix sp.]|nr:hypothetical protein [Labilithrix sp.]